MNLVALAAAESGGKNAFMDFMTKEISFGVGLTVAFWHVFVAILVLVALIVVIAILASAVAKKGKRQYIEPTEVIDVSDDMPEESETDRSREDESEIVESNSVDVVVGKPEEDVVGEEVEEKTEIEESLDEEPETMQNAEEEIVREEDPESVQNTEPEIAQEEKTETVQNTEPEIAQEEKTETVQSAEPEAEKSDESEAERETVATVAEEERAPEKKPVKTKKPAAKKATKSTSEVKEKKAEEPKSDEKTDKAEEEKIEEEKTEGIDAKITGKFEICNSDIGGYNYLLLANNGQLLYESKSYKSVETCREAINNFIEAVKVGRFNVRADKFKNYKFILKSPTSNTLLYIGESFSTENSCKSNIESVKRFAVVSPVVDITEEDFVAKFVRYEIPEATVKSVEEGTGAVGKWEIARVDETTKTSPFVYLLFANNGQLLYESRDYKTYNSCLNGLKTFVNTVKNGYFVIDPDKSGRYKFVLRSQSANSPMEYYGQNYDSQRACASSIESVYHFALRSPLPETN